jgi:hypothetical protein
MSEVRALLDELECSLVNLESEVEESISQLTIEYERAVRHERDRISELQSRISLLRSQELAEVRESCRSSRREAVETLRAEFGDSEFVRFYEKAPI